jgi:hypothetical protein
MQKGNIFKDFINNSFEEDYDDDEVAKKCEFFFVATENLLCKHKDCPLK